MCDYKNSETDMESWELLAQKLWGCYYKIGIRYIVVLNRNCNEFIF